jgi:hypothetical protein
MTRAVLLLVARRDRVRSGQPRREGGAWRWRRLPGSDCPRAGAARAFGLKAPPSAAELAHAAPLRLRAFLLEQLLLAELAAGQPSPLRARFIQSFADEARIPPDQVARCGERRRAGHAAVVQPSAGGPEEWDAVASQWEEVADVMMDRSRRR